MLLHVTLLIPEAGLRRRLRQILAQQDVVPKTITGKKLLSERAAQKTADVILVSDTAIPAPFEKSIGLAKQLPESPTVIAVSERPDADREAELLAAGCDVVLDSRAADPTLARAVGRLLFRRARTAGGLFAAARAIAEPQLADFVSESATMQAFMETVQRVVRSDSSLLILGETGVGKERLARAIHAEGPRSAGPFVAVNCGALPESLLESELFGHEAGSFTRAAARDLARTSARRPLVRRAAGSVRATRSISRPPIDGLNAAAPWPYGGR